MHRWIVLALGGLLALLAVVGLGQFRQLRSDLALAGQTLNDWPQLGYYAEANAQLATPKPGEQRVIFIGDSITALWSTVSPEGFFPGKPYINRGIGGQTTPQILLRFRQDVIALRPKVVVIAAGTNDLAGNTGPMALKAITDNYESMAELATAQQIRVIFASLLPVHDQGHGPDGRRAMQTKLRPPEKIRALNQWLQRYAMERGHTYLEDV